MKELGAPIRQWVPDWLGLICIFIVLSDYPEDTGSLLHQILIVGGFSRPVLPKLDLCPLPERRHIDRL